MMHSLERGAEWVTFITYMHFSFFVFPGPGITFPRKIAPGGFGHLVIQRNLQPHAHPRMVISNFRENGMCQLIFTKNMRNDYFHVNQLKVMEVHFAPNTYKQ